MKNRVRVVFPAQAGSGRPADEAGLRGRGENHSDPISHTAFARGSSFPAGRRRPASPQGRSSGSLRAAGSRLPMRSSRAGHWRRCKRKPLAISRLQTMSQRRFTVLLPIRTVRWSCPPVRMRSLGSAATERADQGGHGRKQGQSGIRPRERRSRIGIDRWKSTLTLFVKLRSRHGKA